MGFAEQPVFEVVGGALELVEGSFPETSPSLAGLLGTLGMRRPLVVAGSRFPGSGIERMLDGAGVVYSVFSGYSANPTEEQASAGLEAFRGAGCDSLVSVGGGSAIDVAKCVKRLAAPGGAGAPGGPPAPGGAIPHVAVPTTAGTGSESTHFAVVYVEGRKASVADPGLHPDAALLDAGLLSGLPAYQRKAALLDALCQAVESHWSARSSAESRAYSALAIPAIARSARAYLEGDAQAARAMLRAANRAGKAINLTTTTAAHAMSYGLTSLYGIPHGHAVALCMPHVWAALLEGGDAGARERLVEIARLITGDPSAEGADGLAAFERLYAQLGMPDGIDAAQGDARALAAGVNAERLANFPLRLDMERIEAMYGAVLDGAGALTGRAEGEGVR